MQSWGRETGGAAILEFALILPVVLILFLGGWEIFNALSTYRKLADMTTQLSSLISVSPASVTQAQIAGDISAASLIMTPYSTTPMSITVTEILTDGPTSTHVCTAAPCTARVQWQVNSAGTADTVQGTTWSALPRILAVPGTGYTIVQTSYAYATTLGSLYLGATIPMSDQLYMSPRQEPVISCSTTGC